MASATGLGLSVFVVLGSYGVDQENLELGNEGKDIREEATEVEIRRDGVYIDRGRGGWILLLSHQ